MHAAGIEVEHLHGPLQFLDVVDTDDASTGVDWQPLLAALRGDLHALVRCPLQIAALSPAMDVRTSVGGVLLAG